MKQKEYSTRKTFLNSAIYSFTNLLQKALSFFLLPFYTIYLKPEDYGLVTLISTFFGFIALLITLALNGAVTKFYFTYKEDNLKLRQFLGTIITGVLFNSLLWLIVLISLNTQITNYFLKNIAFYPYILLALLSTVSSPIYNIYQSILQIKQNAKAYSANSMLYFVIAVSLNLLFIVVFKLGATGLLLANAIPSVLFGSYSVISLIKHRHIQLTFKWPYMKESLIYSIPLIPHLLSGTIADYISKGFLYTKSNLGNVGLYNLAFQFGTILDVIISSINAALFPLVYDTLDNHREKEKKLIKTITFAFKGIVFLAIVMAVLSKEMVFIMTSNVSYHKAWIAIPVISFGTLFYFLYTVYGSLLTYNKKGTRYFWIASVTGNLANIITTFLFTSSFLFLTPAIAGVFYKVIMFLIVFIISRKIEPVNYEINKMMFIILFFVFIIAIGLGVELYNYTENIAIVKLILKIGIIIIAGSILFYEERSHLSFSLSNISNIKIKNIIK